MRTSILRYRVDFVSVLLVCLAVCLQTAAVLLHLPAWFLILVLPMMRFVHLVEHNHSHLGVFRSRSLNAILGTLCQLSCGTPLEFYRLHHVKNHHVYNQGDQDWSSLYTFSNASYPERPVGKAYYVLTFPFITTFECLLVLLRSPGTRQQWSFLLPSLTILAALSFLAWFNWQGVLIFYLLPWMVACFALGYNNYDHHVGCEVEDPHEAANNSLVKWQTLFGFNIGYHIEHHLKPGLHWSKLSQLHAEIAEKSDQKRVS